MLDTIVGKYSAQGSGWRGIVDTKVNDASNNCKDRTKKSVTTAVEANDFIWNTVFLCCESEGTASRLTQELDGTGENIQAPASKHQLNIPHCKWSCVGWAVCVLARPQQVKECNDDHIGSSTKGMSILWKMLCNICNTTYDFNGDRFDAISWRVLFLPRRKHPS